MKHHEYMVLLACIAGAFFAIGFGTFRAADDDPTSAGATDRWGGAVLMWVAIVLFAVDGLAFIAHHTNFLWRPS